MGLLDKLLNEGNNDEKNVNGSEQAAEGVLRTVRFGGYDRKETLMAINRLQNEIYALEQALNAKKLGMSYKVPPEEELSPIREKRAKWESNIGDVYDILADGINRARKKTDAVLARVQKSMRIDYFEDRSIVKEWETLLKQPVE